MANKNYLVVGGSSGIGLSIVKELTKEGNNVLVLSRTDTALAAMARVQHQSFDVLTDEVPEDILPEVLHGVAYCPGSINLKPFRSLKEEAFLEDFKINVLGAVKVLQASEKALKKSGEGSVVLFSTVAVQQGMPYHASVAAAKGALEGLTRSLAAEHAPKIRFNCIAPSLTDTPMAERLLNTEDRRTSSANKHPLKRVGQPEDIANLATFLLDQKSSWITGQVIGVDGGLGSLQL